MTPTVDERLASLIRSLSQVVLPHLPPEASLAQEQVHLSLGHLQILRAQIDAAPAFEVEDGVFHQVTKLIEVLVVVALNKSMLSRRNDSNHALLGGLLEDGIGIVTTVGKEVVSSYAFNEGTSLRAISGGT